MPGARSRVSMTSDLVSCSRSDAGSSKVTSSLLTKEMTPLASSFASIVIVAVLR